MDGGGGVVSKVLIIIDRMFRVGRVKRLKPTRSQRRSELIIENALDIVALRL